MSEPDRSAARPVVVEQELTFTLYQLSRACLADAEQVRALVDEGVLTPRAGNEPPQWVFAGDALTRARLALRLTRDLDLNAAGAALVLDLLDQIDALQARLQRLGAR